MTIIDAGDVPAPLLAVTRIWCEQPSRLSSVPLAGEGMGKSWELEGVCRSSVATV